MDRTTDAAPQALLLAACAAALAFPAALTAQERHVLTGPDAVLWNLAGEVRIEPGSGSDVAVEVTRGGADGRQLTVQASGGRLIVRYPDNEIVYRRGRDGRSSTTLRVNRDGTFGNGHSDGGQSTRIRTQGSGLEAHADLRVSVPRGRRLTVHLAVGEVSVANVDGELRLDVHAARVTTTGTKGRLSVDVGSGSVRIEDAEGDLDVDTGSGSVTVAGFRGQRVALDGGSGSLTLTDVTAERVTADVGSGRTTLRRVATDELRLDSGSGGIEAQLDKVPRSTRIETGSGSVRLSLPDNASAELHLSTGSGGISSDFPVTANDFGRRTLRGRIGDGGATIRVSTGSGSVRIIRN